MPCILVRLLFAKSGPLGTVFTIGSSCSVAGLILYPTKGHSVFAFPDQTDFVPNSNYYLFSIPQRESENNPNL